VVVIDMVVISISFEDLHVGAILLSHLTHFCSDVCRFAQ